MAKAKASAENAQENKQPQVEDNKAEVVEVKEATPKADEIKKVEEVKAQKGPDTAMMNVIPLVNKILDFGKKRYYMQKGVPISIPAFSADRMLKQTPPQAKLNI